jgi:hypothetical protein
MAPDRAIVHQAMLQEDLLPGNDVISGEDHGTGGIDEFIRNRRRVFWYAFTLSRLSTAKPAAMVTIATTLRHEDNDSKGSVSVSAIVPLPQRINSTSVEPKSPQSTSGL